MSEPLDTDKIRNDARSRLESLNRTNVSTQEVVEWLETVIKLCDEIDMWERMAAEECGW